MKVFDSFLGNEELKKTLGNSIVSSGFSHAYIIEGAKGTGKRTVARLAAAAIMCKDKNNLPCGICPTCKKILNDNCADVRFIEITKVEQARELKAKLYDSSVECDYKIYVITDAHKMNLRAQNALLISLEEPPKNVVFFLLTTDAGALIETIRSRAQILRTKRLDDKTIFDYIRKNRRDITLTDESLKEIIIASGGSLGYALDMADSKKSESVIAERSKAVDFTSAILRDDNDTVSFLFALSTSSRDELKELISLSLEVLGDIISLKKDIDAPLYFFSSRESARELSSKFNISRVMGVYSALLTALDDLNSNCQQALTLMSILTNSAKKGN